MKFLEQGEASFLSSQKIVRDHYVITTSTQ